MLFMVYGLLGLAIFLACKLEWSKIEIGVIDELCFRMVYPLLFLIGVPLIDVSAIFPMVQTALALQCILVALWLIGYVFATVRGATGAQRLVTSQMLSYSRFAMYAGPVLMTIFGPQVLILVALMAVIPFILTKKSGAASGDVFHTFSVSSSYAAPAVIGLLLGVLVALLPQGELELQFLWSVFQLLSSSLVFLILLRSAIEASVVRLSWHGLVYILGKALLALVICAGLIQIGFRDEAIIMIGLALIVPSWFLLETDGDDIAVVEKAGITVAQSQFWFFLMLISAVPVFLVLSAYY